MALPLEGVRIIEVASHVFVPIAGAALSEWGAQVIKIEHPETGDPYRGLVTAGLHHLHDGVDPYFQSANRGKRSIGLDLKHPDGRRLLSELMAECDVFVTSLRVGARRRLQIDVDDIRADNPSTIYVRGTAFGSRGPDAHRGGFDGGVYWGRTGMQYVYTPPDAPWPTSPRPAFGDVVGGITIAGAVSTALYRRAVTGETSVVDVSLLASGMWQLQPDIVQAKLGQVARQKFNHFEPFNPLTQSYRTADGRFLGLMMLAPDARWPDLCRSLGRPELAEDPRFVNITVRRENGRACVEILDAIFAEKDLNEWRQLLHDFEGQWTPIQTPGEVHTDPQVVANGYIADVEMSNGGRLPMVTSPVQFDEQPNQPVRGPEHGEHTEAVLLDLGLSWDEINALKDSGAIL